jgi:hypothetical protein
MRLEGYFKKRAVRTAAESARRELLAEIAEDLGALRRFHRTHAVFLHHQVEGRIP